MKYIALIRGINVGNKNRIKMADLITIFESMGFENIRTYLQSGNIVFNSDLTNTADITGKIEKKLINTFEYSVSVIIRTVDELEDVIKGNPLLKKKTLKLISYM